MVCGKVERMRKAVENIAKNCYSLGIKLKQNCRLSSVKKCIYGGSLMNSLEVDSNARWEGIVRVLILQENQMSKTQVVHPINSACFCDHCGNIKA